MKAASAETKEGLVITSRQASGTCYCVQTSTTSPEGVGGVGGTAGVEGCEGVVVSLKVLNGVAWWCL